MKNLNITKQVLLLLLTIIGGGSLKAQNDSTYVYQSFFGNDSTTVNLHCLIIDSNWNLTFTLYNSDTITMNNHLYYFVEPKQIESVPEYNTYNYSNATIYFREDRQDGRLYLYVINNYVEEEILLCDMSLNVGDTFTMPAFPYEIEVQNIRMEDGSKIVEFGEFNSQELYVDNLMFNEGVFPMVIPALAETTFVELICQHKDGELLYENPELALEHQNCLMATYLSTEEIKTENLMITPTIFSSNELISININSEIKDVKMLDMLGREINISVNATDSFMSQISLNQNIIQVFI